MKLLVTSDIHIYNYAQYASVYNRLDKFIELAHRLVEMGKELECPSIILAGDISHKPVNQPDVEHVIKNFLEILGKSFNKIYYILGQHDLSSKSNNQGYVDSSIHLFMPSNAEYMDKKIIDVDGKSIAFCNWMPDQDWSFIKNKVDILVGHLTISSLFGQPYDADKYTLGVFGDIHNKTVADEGRSYCINVPIPHYQADDQDGTAGVLDTDNMSFTRHPTISDSFKYLQMFYDDATYDLKSNEYIRLIERPAKVLSKSHFHRSINIEEVISTLVDKHNLRPIHEEARPLLDLSEIVDVSFDYVLTSLDIKNFRSIKDYTYEFKSGITLVSGENGSGKSSIMRALEFALIGNSQPRNLVHTGEDQMMCSIKLVYKDQIHIISRGWQGGGVLKYSIDGEEISGRMRDVNTTIFRNLPFLNFYNILYRKQSDNGFLADHGYAERVDLIVKLLKLDIVDLYSKVSSKLLSSTKDNIKSLAEQNLAIESKLEVLDKDYSSLDSKDELTGKKTKLSQERASAVEDIKNIELREKTSHEIDIIKSKISEINEDYYSDIKNKSTLLEDLEREKETSERLSAILVDINKIKELKTKEELLNAGLVEVDEDLAGKEISTIAKEIDDGEKLRNDFNERASLYTRRSDSIGSNIQDYENTLSSLREQLADVATTCPTCDSSLSEEKINKVKDGIRTKISKTEIHIISCEDELKDLGDIPSDLDIEGLTTYLSELYINRSKITEENKKSLSNKEITDKITDVQDDMLGYPSYGITSEDASYNITKSDNTIKDYELALARIAVLEDDKEKKTASNNMYLGQIETLEYKFTRINKPENSKSELESKLESIDSELTTIEVTLGQMIALENDKVLFDLNMVQWSTNKTLAVAEELMLVDYVNYNNLFSKQGDVLRSVFAEVGTLLSDKDITVTTFRELVGGELRLDFDITYKVQDLVLPYSDLSGGQQSLVDVYFLTKLFKLTNGVGSFILDETLKFLGDDPLEKAALLIKESPIATVMISTHVSSFAYYDNRLLVELKNNKSIYHPEGGV